MNEARSKHVSKFLSLVLRHKPEEIGIMLDESGWTSLDELLQATHGRGIALTLDEVKTVVATSDKQRFAISPDGLRIRANQGHSVPVELGYAAAVPPGTLYHGTSSQFLDAIRVQGLCKMSRHHVHLSASRDQALRVGQRRAHPVVLAVQSHAMHAAGLEFFLSTNGVWLTDHVPVTYLTFP